MTDEVIVDARGMRCPWPVLRLARAMRGVDHAILRADDPATAAEVQALAAAQGWQVAECDCAKMEQQWRISRSPVPA